MKFRLKVDTINKSSGKKISKHTLTIDAKNKLQAFNMIKSFNRKFSGGKTKLSLISIKRI